MLWNECRRSRCRVGATVGKLAVILVVLTVASWAPGAPKKDKDQDQEFTPVYQHTVDEVFQASQEAIERLGWFVTDKDKDKGTISGYHPAYKTAFDIHIEALNTKPETRVTITVKTKYRNFRKDIEQRLPTQIQKVLATYH